MSEVSVRESGMNGVTNCQSYHHGYQWPEQGMRMEYSEHSGSVWSCPCTNE